MMAKMKAGDSQALSAMAADSGTDLAGYQAQLKTTHLFWTPADTLAVYLLAGSGENHAASGAVLVR